MGFIDGIKSFLFPQKSEAQIKFEAELKAKTQAKFQEAYIKQATLEASNNGKIAAKKKYGQPIKPIHTQQGIIPASSNANKIDMDYLMKS